MARNPSGDLEELRALARARWMDNVHFLEFLQWRLTWTDRKLDREVRKLSEEVMVQVECRECAHCCRTLSFDLSEADLDRLAAGLGMDAAEAQARYFPAGASGQPAMRPPCPFLVGGSCTIYADRPGVCRDYPHLTKGKIRHRTNTLLDNSVQCPVVFRTLERLKQRLGYPRHG